MPTHIPQGQLKGVKNWLYGMQRSTPGSKLGYGFILGHEAFEFPAINCLILYDDTNINSESRKEKNLI